jgi:hypothetical protein
VAGKRKTGSYGIIFIGRPRFLMEDRHYLQDHYGCAIDKSQRLFSRGTMIHPASVGLFVESNLCLSSDFGFTMRPKGDIIDPISANEVNDSFHCLAQSLDLLRGEIFQSGDELILDRVWQL